MNNKAKECVHFLGHIKREEVFSLYPKFDCYVMSSRFESLGLVVLEAMRAGLPILAADICEMPKIIKNELNGILFKKNDDYDLYKKINNLYNNPQLVEKMEISARRYFIEHYKKSSPTRNIYDYFQNIIKNKTGT